jgi:HAD superfamily hydrolase (TIGR01509 family)
MKTILVDAVHALFIEQNAQYVVDSNLFNLLETFPNPKIVLTNADDAQMEMFGLSNSPYPVFTLKHNPNKPDPNYFETFLKDHNLSASEVVYFEHDSAAVESARSVGIKTLLYNSETPNLDELEEFFNSNL